MDRCCGFAAHLATLAVEDRTRSCEVLANLEKLRALSTSVELAAKGPLPPQTFLDHWKGKVAATLSQAAVQLDQVLVLLRAWPRDEAAPVQATELAVGRLQAHLAPLEQCARLLAPPATRGLLGHPEPDLLEGAVQQLAALSREAHQSSGTLCPPLARHLWALAEPLDVLAEDWAQAQAPSPDGEAPPSDALARRLLVAVQRLHGHLGGAPGDPASGPHLTLLRDNMQEAFVRMDLERTCKLTGRLVRHLRRHGVDENASRACDAVVPLLRQYVGACCYLASLQLATHRSGLKLLHILASLFSTLAKKASGGGLCLPEEWREELEREGAPELQELEDGGLGEGEGAKDVSDRIESQDQLEGTRSEQKEEPEEEQRAPKDEEHGVEMTEDFEAPAQDPEEGEGEEGDESEEEDNDELDDQMGDVQGDDQLDQELWDKEEQEDSKEEEEEEVAAEGEPCAEEPQLGARDEDAAPQREEPAGAPPEDEKAPDDGPEVAPEGPPDDSTIGEPPDPQVTPEPLNLPEDMQLGSDAEDAEGEEPQEAPPPETVEEAEEEGEDQATEDKMEQGEEEGEGTQEGAPPPIDMQNLDGAVPEAEDGGTDGAGASHGATPQGASTEEHGPQEKESEQGGRAKSCAEVGTGQSDADTKDPGTSLKTSHERSLADKEENKAGKRLHTVDSKRAPKEASETFRHVEDDEAHDEVALDTATLDQTQGGIEFLEEEQVPETLRPESPQEETPEPPQESAQRERASGHQQPSAGEDPVPRQGPVAETAHVERGPEASFHTRMDVLEGEEEERARAPEPEQELCSAESHAWAAWEEAERAVAPLVTELCEQLRLVLEPTRASRLRGDFRSGKRLSMRRVIAYLASQLRRDKMWLRRVQPSQRQYRVLLAVDDSLSMGPSGPLALQSLALLAQALSLLEAGELAVASFGESVRLLHPLGRPWTREAGANVAGALGFDQGRTRVAPLLRAAEALLPAGPDAARLVLLVSDGRGICSEGDVAAAVRDAHSQGLLMVFLVLDCLGGKDSILEVRKPEFGPSGEVRLRSYMEHFPFPFYLLLRDLASMPAVLGEALRQWLELVAQA
ncbi:unnamed protein product [Ixodes pacificus]